MKFRDDEFKEVLDADVVSVNMPEDDKDNPEKNKEFCYICRRSADEAGELMHIPGNICVCMDCMQKTFDNMKNGGMFGMPPVTGNNPGKNNDDKNNNDNNNQGMPNISMINLGDFAQMMNPRLRVTPKKEKKKVRNKPVIDINSIPAPHRIKAKLDEYVVGQEQAKKVMSVAVYNHYKRVLDPVDEEDPNFVEIEKSNMLMLGPTGSGKTYLVRTLARLLDVPLAITDATSLTEAGYIGDDIESVVSKLLAAADNDVEKAEKGIIFIDEIDKIAKKKNAHQRDVSGESVQQGMLKLLEGSEVEVPVGASNKNAMVPMATVNTKNILFICGGAFPDMTDIIKERLNKNASMGFGSDLKDKYSEDEDLLKQVTTEDVRKYGMIPEFIGRLPVILTLSPLDEDMLVRILTEPKNSIIKQYKKLLSYDEVDLEFEDEEEEPAVEETPSTEPAPTTESTSTSGGASGSGGHVKDSTTTTADGDFDPRYALSLGFLLLGVAFILYSKRRKMNYVKEGRSSR